MFFVLRWVDGWVYVGYIVDNRMRCKPTVGAKQTGNGRCNLLK